MSNGSVMRDLFDRWERVWHEGQYGPIPSCAGPNYIRHDEAGDRTISREAYATEIAKIREERPNIRVVVYDHSFAGNRAWFRFAFKWPDPKTGELRSRAGMQSYRIEAGKLAETWLILLHWARHGPTPLRRSIGRARRQSSKGIGGGLGLACLLSPGADTPRDPCELL
jgi:SnoaL-like domain